MSNIFARYLLDKVSRPVVAPELGELVLEDGDDCLRGGDLGPEAEQEQHQEEEYGPDRGDGHLGRSCDSLYDSLVTAYLGHGLWVGDEGEPRALGHHVLDNII